MSERRVETWQPRGARLLWALVFSALGFILVTTVVALAGAPGWVWSTASVVVVGLAVARSSLVSARATSAALVVRNPLRSYRIEAASVAGFSVRYSWLAKVDVLAVQTTSGRVVKMLATASWVFLGRRRSARSPAAGFARRCADVYGVAADV